MLQKSICRLYPKGSRDQLSNLTHLLCFGKLVSIGCYGIYVPSLDVYSGKLGSLGPSCYGIYVPSPENFRVTFPHIPIREV